jgi:ADP-heptose:LPS heptosyltransferase
MTTDAAPATILVYPGVEIDDALGECILKVPFLRALRMAYPQAKISWVHGIGPCFFAGALQPLVADLIDEIIPGIILRQRPSPFDLLRNPLPGPSYDLIIDTQKFIQRTLMLRRVRHTRFITSAWRYRVFSDAAPPAELVQPKHLVDKLLGLVAAATGRVIKPPPVVALAPEWTALARTLLPPGPIYLGIAPGAGNKTRGKVWPLDRFIAVARDQQAKGRTPVFLIGPGEAGWVEAIRSGVPGVVLPGWENGPPKGAAAAPAATVAMGGLLTAAIANCSGTGHMLAAGGAPMVSLYGPTDPEKYVPYSTDPIVVSTFRSTRKIEDVALDEVVAAVDRRIAKNSSRAA